MPTPAPTPAPQTLTQEPRPRPPGLLRIGLLALIVAKFVLISHEEILPYLQDDNGFADSAAAYVWQAPYALYTYVKQPVYPLFVSGTMLTGVPLRLAHELIWAIACWGLAISLWRIGLGRIAALAAGGLTLFHPWSIFVLNRVLMDSLYVPLFTLFTAALVAGGAARSRAELRHWGVLAALAGGLAANTRQETVLVYGLGALAAGLAAFAWWRRGIDRRLALWRAGWLGLAPVAAALVVAQAICAANYARIGAWVTYDQNLPGFKSLYRTLLSIPPETPVLHIPVPRDVRERAYAASPSFARLRPYLDGEFPAREFLEACRAETKVTGEYGGWTFWALRDAAWRMNDWKWTSARDLDAFYAQCAEELRAAQHAGVLASRWAPVAYLAPEWVLMAGATPEVAWRCGKELLNPAYQRDRTGGGNVNRYDAVANRRAAPTAITTKGEAPGSAWHRRSNVEYLDRSKAAIGRVVAGATQIGLAAGAAGLLACVVIRRRPAIPAAIWHGAVLLLAAFATRFALVALLDMGAITAQIRYLWPASPPLLALEILGVGVGGAAVSAWWRSRHRALSPLPAAPLPTLTPVEPIEAALPQGATDVSSSASAPASYTFRSASISPRESTDTARPDSPL